MTKPTPDSAATYDSDILIAKRANLVRNGFEMGNWQVEPRRNRIVSVLSSEKGERRLDPKVMAVLVELATRPGEVFSRTELSEAIWPDVFVNDNTVSQAVSRLRKALGDEAGKPQFIETISKSGYRLLPEVRVVVPEPALGTGRGVAVAVLAGVTAVLVASLVVSRLVGVSAQPAVESTDLQGPSPEVVPELTLVGNQFEPTLAPDGDRVAFCWRQSPELPWSIWTQDVGADNPVRLTTSESNERLPTWAPDGKSIAYVRFPDGDRPAGIYRTTLLGRQTDRIGDAIIGMRGLQWSPDGQTLALSAPEPPADIATASEAGLGPTRIVLLKIGQPGLVPLTFPDSDAVGDRGPVFSPDGSLIAFERRHSESRHDVMVIDARGHVVRHLTRHEWGQLRGLDWRSDGKAILFSSNRSGPFALWEIDVAGGDPTRVPIHDAWVTQPSVSRSGGRLLYRTFRDVVDVWALPLNAHGSAAGEPVRSVPSTRSERDAVWSPTRDRIAFVSDRSGSAELWSGRSDGTDLVRHTSFSGPIPQSPRWSPDGKRLLFDAATEGNADIWVVSRDSRHPARLTVQESDERNATFSRDGESIYFASNRSNGWQIWKMQSSGGRAEQITTEGGFLAQEAVDGGSLYFSTAREPGVWQLPLRDPARPTRTSPGVEAVLVIGNMDLADCGSWTVGNTGVYYVKRGPTAIHLRRHEDGADSRVFEPTKQIPLYERTLSLSADGSSLLFSMIDRSDDEVLRVDLAGL